MSMRAQLHLPVQITAVVLGTILLRCCFMSTGILWTVRDRCPGRPLPLSHSSRLSSKLGTMQLQVSPTNCYYNLYYILYMGSSSVLVLIGSHSLCNSFVINQFLFFTPNGENSLCYTPKKQWEQYGGEKNVLFIFISKIYSHVTQKWRPKTGMAIPYCLCWKLLHTRGKYSGVSNLFAKLQHAKAPES